MKKRIIYIWVLIVCFVLLDCKETIYAKAAEVEQNIEKTIIKDIMEDEENNKNSKTLGRVIDTLRSITFEVIGAFLGFLSAIAFANRSNKAESKKLDTCLHNELEAIHNELRERIEGDDFKDFFRYQIPIWEINLASGSLALLTNAKVYDRYINIYSKIQYAQVLESEYIHTKISISNNDFSYRYLETIDQARKREAKAILESIQEILSVDKKKKRS